MRRDGLAVFWLWVTACTCGAVVMAVELFGVRMLSPVYGASQTVWAAMISVTLLSLTIGYFVGGSLADRCPRPALLYGVILTAAALLAACPYARVHLRPLRDALGLEAGALASSAVVFFLPLGLLGMTSPFVIKVITQRGRKVGMAAGGVYAISTIGSVAGTLATGLYLMAWLGAPAGFRLAAVVAAAAAAIGLITAAGLKGGPALLVPVALAFVPSPHPRIGETYTTPSGANVVVLDVRDSRYGHITVLDEGDYRLLVVNGIVQTGVSHKLHRMGPGEHLLINYFQELLPYTVDDPTSRTAVLIGVAGGLTATLLEKHGIEVDAVDLDPEMFRVARRWFSFRGKPIIADGRQFLEDCATQYDFCVIDTYSGDAFPFYMATVEAFRAARAALTPDGVLAVNFIGSPIGRPFACVHRTLGEVFPHVLALNGEDSTDVQTITLFASARPIEFNKGWLDDLGSFTGTDSVSAAIDRLTVEPSRTDGLLLTDAFAPVDLMRSDEAIRWRERTVERIGRAARF